MKLYLEMNETILRKLVASRRLQSVDQRVRGTRVALPKRQGD